MTRSNSDTNGAGAVNGPRTFGSFREIADFLWQNAERMRGAYKPNEYDKVILPLLVVRRLDCVLESTKEKVLARLDALRARGMKATDTAVDVALRKVTGVPFYNTSKLDFAKLKGDPDHIGQNLRAYLKGFSVTARDIIEQFKFDEQITRLDDANLLFQVLGLFADVNLHPDAVPNHVMGSVFEELIRRFNEKKNEEAGDHYTPREIIRLMVDLLFIEDDDALRKPGIVRTLFDPACGTGGMLSVAEEYLRELNPNARLEVFGEELNPEAYAVCKSDMIIKGQNPENIVRGNAFDQDGHPGSRFDYMLSNPPFGVDWKNVQKTVEDERDNQGFSGRFGSGTPRINDGALLFLQHMISKMKPVDGKTGEGGSRIAIVLNGSPLFTGDAGSGESEIRRWILENDWLEAIVALPDQLFYNTGISTYIWVLTNRKPKKRRGKVQLINAVDLFQKMRKSLGNKRHELSPGQIATIARIFGDFCEGEISKIFDNEDFGYLRITVERPLRLAFRVTPERIARLREEKAFAGLASSKKKGPASEAEIAAGKEMQEAIVAALARIEGTRVYKNRDRFEEDLDGALNRAGLNVATPVRKSILAAIGERDETAEACTDAKGLDPSVTMRPSGNESIGSVPIHWMTLRNKAFLYEVNERSENGDEELLTVSHLTGVTPRSEKRDVTMFLAESLVDYKRVKKDDIAINTMWAWMGALGVSPCDGIVSPSYNVYRPRAFQRVDPAYFDMLARTPPFVAEINRWSRGIWTSRLRLYPQEFLNMISPLPSFEEQREIVAHARTALMRDDALSDIASKSVLKLREYRQALITAAVTGKLDVDRAGSQTDDRVEQVAEGA